MRWLPLLAEGEGGMEAFMKSPLPLLLMFFVVMIVFMGRSSARQRREQAAMLAALKKNDKVITTAGIIGVVVAMTDTEVTLKVDETSNSRIRILRSAIMQVNPTEPQQSTAQPQQPTP